mmetsp:Transcript_4670/g.10979  ORF Transcript_4670/g.10979 Transcript_4670/m.10979 type:complete len:216 (+) Transcript_4670:166-813(+)
MSAGKKMSPKSTMRRHPRARVAASFETSESAWSRAWKRSALGSSARMAGGESSIFTTASVTMSVPVALCTKADSLKVPTDLKRRGPSTSKSISSRQGTGGRRPTASSAGVGSVLAPSGKPNKGAGMWIGKLHCPGCSQTSASGNAAAKGPANALCSRATVPRTMCLTGPCSASRALTIARCSLVGATGLCTHRPPPPPASLTTVSLTGTFTFTTP